VPRFSFLFFASGIRLIPRYPKRKYFFIQQLANTVLLSIVLTLLAPAQDRSVVASPLRDHTRVLWTSVRFTNRVARDRVT